MAMEINDPGPDVKPHLVVVCPENAVAVAQSSLQEHISSLSEHEVTPKLVPFQCSECLASKQLTKVFSTQRLFNKHVRDCHGERRFKCQVCFKGFTKPSTLKYHKRIHTVNLEKHMKCKLCPKTFGTKQTLHKHLFRVHKKKVGGVKYFKCSFCVREFVENSRLERHVSNKHIVDSEFPCPVCSKTFIDPSTLEKHVAGHDLRESFICDVCSKEYQHRFSLRKHLKLQHDKFFNCFKCCRSFSNKGEFDQHKLASKSKTSTVELKCGICLEFFHSQCNLDIHTNSHLKEIKITTKEEPEIKSAPSKHIDDNVKTNLPKSTQELHTCDLCLQTFDRESRFRLHRDLVHPNAIWKCNFEQCSKSFSWYSRLKKHKIEHSNSAC